MKTLKCLLPLLVVLCACGEKKAAEEDLYNTKAAVPTALDLSTLQLRVVNTSINKQQHITSILYGNEAAYGALKNEAHTLKGNAVLTLITWQQQEDPHWFGANIPGDLVSVETLKPSGNDGAMVDYQRLEGPSLAATKDTAGNESRIRFILQQRPSIMP